MVYRAGSSTSATRCLLRCNTTDRASPGRVARPDQVLLGTATLALAVLAGLLALVGAFLSPSEPRVFGVPIPVGVLIAIGGNLAVGIGGAWGTRSRVAPAVTGFVWLVVGFILGRSR